MTTKEKGEQLRRLENVIDHTHLWTKYSGITE